MRFVVASDASLTNPHHSVMLNFTRSWGTPVGAVFAAAQEGDAVVLGFVVVDAVDALL